MSLFLQKEEFASVRLFRTSAFCLVPSALTINHWLVWQLVDSAFPSGGFTHSGGLEAAAQHGDVATVDDVGRTAAVAVKQAGRLTLPIVLAAHRSPGEVESLDALADLVLNQPVGNRASRAQGRSFLASAARVFPQAPIHQLAEETRVEDRAGHHAPIFGAVLSHLGLDADTTARLFLYHTGRTVTAAGVRLGLLGVFDAQRLQPALAQEIDATLDGCRSLRLADIAQTAPILDLFQSTHDRLYSRLFQS